MCAAPFLMTTERCHITCFLFTCLFFPKSLHLGSVRMCCFHMSPQWAIYPRLYSSQIQLDSLPLLWVLSQSWSPNISFPKIPLYHRLSVTWRLQSSIQLSSLGSGVSNKSQLYRAFISGLWLFWSLDPRLISLRESLTFLKLFSPKAPFSQRLFYTVWHFRSLWNAPHVRLGCKSLSMRASPL